MLKIEEQDTCKCGCGVGKSEKIETCYFCLQKFNMNNDDASHYKYDKYPMCAYCSEFYGFYKD